MAASQVPAATDNERAEPNHGLRIFLIWIVLALIADLLIWFVWYPHMPPGRMTDSAASQQFDIAVLALAAAPVMLFVYIYFGYTFVNWRHRDGDEDDGPPLFGNTRIQATWIVGTAVIVLAAFVFGTVELIAPAGAGAGEGPLPVWNPSSANRLQVQVIGQQWQFTYRYPQFGGMETTQLLLPANRSVVFHVTSLDVIHSFWAYQLGVKADANPMVDNVAYTSTKSELGSFTVRCSELCGIWHGAMFDYGRIVTPAAFAAWARATENSERHNGALAVLPKYALTYDPTVVSGIGKALIKEGITGGAGYYYPPSDPVTP
jgi:cytochrome c oxidase subunit II